MKCKLYWYILGDLVQARIQAGAHPARAPPKKKKRERERERGGEERGSRRKRYVQSEEKHLLKHL